MGEIDLVYDRASLVALPEPMRMQYIAKVDELLPIDGQQLVNTLEYAPVRPEPPFSVPPAKLHEYYGKTHQIRHVEQTCIPNHGLIRAWGLDYVKEHGFLLTKTRSEL